MAIKSWSLVVMLKKRQHTDRIQVFSFSAIQTFQIFNSDIFKYI